MKLFAKGKGQGEPAAQAPAYRPIDRMGLLGLLDQVVNGGQAGVLELREPRGSWVYAFQGGALTHASGGRVRGARQAFDLLWEFQSGEFMFTPGVNPSLAGNLYIDKSRLLDLLRRSQAVLQGPSAPYIPPGQQRPIAPVPRPYSPPSPAQMPPAWQPGQQAQPGWPPVGQPVPPAPGWGAGYPPQPAAPGYPAPTYPGQQGQTYAPQPGQPYPPQQGQPYPPQQGQPYPAQAYPPAAAPMPQPAPPMPQQAPAYPGYPGQPQMPPQPMPQRPVPQAPPMMPQPPAPAPAPIRPVAPPSFSVPPMAIPRKQAAVPSYQPPVPVPAPPASEPPKAAPPKDDLAALRASLVAQAPQVRPAPTGPAWNVRTAEGAVAPPPAAGGAKGKGKDKGKDKGKAKGKKGDSKLMALIKVQLIKFLLWACERRYSPDDHWTLKDAFEVSTMELRDQFFGAFAQMLESNKKNKPSADDDMDDMAAGRMRGRGRRH